MVIFLLFCIRKVDPEQNNILHRCNIFSLLQTGYKVLPLKEEEFFKTSPRYLTCNKTKRVRKAKTSGYSIFFYGSATSDFNLLFSELLG